MAVIFIPVMQVQMKHSARETNEDYDLNTNLLNAWNKD